MLVDLVVLVVGLVILAYVGAHAKHLRDRPRHGTEWAPSQRIWLVVLGCAALLMVVGSLINLIRG
jgi:hypothetical protein